MHTLNRLSYMDIKQLGVNPPPQADAKRSEQADAKRSAEIDAKRSEQAHTKAEIRPHQARTPPETDPARRQPAEFAPSKDAQAVAKAIETASKRPDVDSTKVERLRAAINDGSYHIDSNKLAGNIIQFEQQFRD